MEMGLMASVFTVIDNSSNSRQSVTKITIILADRLAEIVVSATVARLITNFTAVEMACGRPIRPERFGNATRI